MNKPKWNILLRESGYFVLTWVEWATGCRWMNQTSNLQFVRERKPFFFVYGAKSLPELLLLSTWHFWRELHASSESPSADLRPPPSARHTPSYLTSQPLIPASQACRCMLIATCVVSGAKAALVYVRFYSLWTFFFFLNSALSFIPASVFSFSLDITEQMTALTPKPGRWDGEISDRQCLAHVPA